MLERFSGLGALTAGFGAGLGVETEKVVSSEPRRIYSVVHMDTPVASFTKIRLPENDGAPQVGGSATL